jgi:hypothetical protein
MQTALLGTITVDLEVPDQIRICQILEKKNGNTVKAMHQLLTDFKKGYDLVSDEVLQNILTKFGIPMKPVRLTEMYLHKTYSAVHIHKYLL